MYNVIYIVECTQWYVLLYWAIDPSIKILFIEQRTSSFKHLHVVKILNDFHKLLNKLSLELASGTNIQKMSPI